MHGFPIERSMIVCEQLVAPERLAGRQFFDQQAHPIVLVLQRLAKPRNQLAILEP
jgi:hypothetical protein